MSVEVPEGWGQHPLTALADYHNGRAFKPSDWSVDGLPIIRISNMTSAAAGWNCYAGSELRTNVLVNSGDLLFSWSATLMTMLWDRGPAILNQHIFKVVEKPGHDRQFVKHALDRNIENLAGLSHGSTMKHIKRGTLSSFKILVPPLAEQQKIAAILTAVDDAIRATEAVIAQTRTVKAGLLQDLLTQGIGPDGRPHTEFQQTELGPLPVGWTVRRLGDLFHTQLGKMVSKEARTGPEQRLYLRNINVRWRHIDVTDLKTLHFSTRDLKKFALKPGDILMCEGRALGRSAIWRGEVADCYYQKALHRIRSKAGLMTADFLVNYSYYAFKVADLFAGDRLESTIPHLTKERLTQLQLPVPPVKEQQRIDRVIGAAWSQIRDGEAWLTQLKTLKAGLLQDLLTGKVRVTP